MIDVSKEAPTACPAGNAAAEVASGPIVRHDRIAEETWRLRVLAPNLAATARPGQFAMVRLPGRCDPLLARPLAVYETALEADGGPPGPQEATAARYADFIYAVHGKFTQALSRAAVGESIEFWGPLGNGFAPNSAGHLLLVAGGIGQTALLALGKERLGIARYGTPVGASAARADRVTLLWGCRTGSLFGDVEDFRDAGIDVHLATLDGSIGRSGTVVDLLDAFSAEAAGRELPGRRSVRIACCGPEGMMAAVSTWAAGHGVPCEVSLETPMACGVGICFSCVAPVRDASGGWDYRRTCIEGPVFDSTLIAW